MDKPVLYVITAFFILGGIDYILGNPLKIGNKFEEGFKVMGTLALGMVGIFSLSPALLKLIAPLSSAVSGALHIDPSVIPASIFPIDMGGLKLSESLAKTTVMGRFSGVIIASSLGATIGFTLPVACGFIKKEDEKPFAKGIVIGVISIPFGCLAAGLLCGIDLLSLLRNLLPVIILTLLCAAGLAAAPSITLKAFMIFGRLIAAVSMIGVLIQGLLITAGIQLLPDLLPFGDTILVVGKITLVLAGAYPMMEVLNRLFKKVFDKIGRMIGVNTASVTAILGNFATNLLVFGNFRELNEKGKVLCTSLAVSCAFIFGDQFAYLASVDSNMSGAFFLAKLVSGALCFLFVTCFTKDYTEEK